MCEVVVLLRCQSLLYLRVVLVPPTPSSHVEVLRVTTCREHPRYRCRAPPCLWLRLVWSKTQLRCHHLPSPLLGPGPPPRCSPVVRCSFWLVPPRRVCYACPSRLSSPSSPSSSSCPLPLSFCRGAALGGLLPPMPLLCQGRLVNLWERTSHRNLPRYIYIYICVCVCIYILYRLNKF